MQHQQYATPTGPTASPVPDEAPDDDDDDGRGDRRQQETGYDQIKALKKELRAEGRRVNTPDLIALSSGNDPYYAGSPANIVWARWFASLWERFQFRAGTHLRRIHYAIIVQPDTILLPDGSPYLNTLECWEALNRASKPARYLGLVEAEDFIDRRNPAPQILIEPPLDCPGYEDSATPSVEIDVPIFEPPTLIFTTLFFPFPVPEITGYAYRRTDQPYHVELLVEKSTMDDVLIPVCQRLDVNLVTAKGFNSITGAIALVRRAEAHGRPTRILYISDYDPAGEDMPAAYARQIEYWNQRLGVNADIKLDPLVLSAEQARHYQLPRTPIKESDLRKARFETRHGEGATELDALELLHPGELAKLVSRAVKVYRDPNLPSALRDAAVAAEAQVDDAWQNATREERGELDLITQGVKRVLADFRPLANAVRDWLAIEMRPYRDRLKSVQRAIEKRANDLCSDLPDRPEPDIDEPDESDWLFDSARSYLEQMEHYQSRKGSVESVESPA